MPAKYKVGDKVHCFRENSPFDFDFTGEVLSSDKAEDTYEYHVSNAPKLNIKGHFPLLLWEEEMELIP